MKKKVFISFFILVFFFISCEKGNDQIKQKLIISQETRNETVYQENETFTNPNTVIEEQFPLEIANTSNTIVNDINLDWDDSAYNDKDTVEFCLTTADGKIFCLYHNIRKIDGFDSSIYNVFKDWSTAHNIRKWCEKTENDLYIRWNYTNGAIVHMETESPLYTTRRGIKVGDSINDVIEAYKEYKLYRSNEAISLNLANMIAEEIMILGFWLENDIVTKIEITIGT
ncbi:MAG: hypothetical protein J5647_01290 [Spirochaetaceae bacterium]|nr:hypothetical protein [Spirochaetaceae bacterium]